MSVSLLWIAVVEAGKDAVKALKARATEKVFQSASILTLSVFTLRSAGTSGLLILVAAYTGAQIGKAVVGKIGGLAERMPRIFGDEPSAKFSTNVVTAAVLTAVGVHVYREDPSFSVLPAGAMLVGSVMAKVVECVGNKWCNPPATGAVAPTVPG